MEKSATFTVMPSSTLAQTRRLNNGKLTSHLTAENCLRTLCKELPETSSPQNFYSLRLPECHVVGHVHDEGITLVVDDLLVAYCYDMVAIMSVEESWAPGLLLGADGYEDPYYHK